ncbi:MAG: hypothetical protein L3J46_09690, partial [Kangiellaceae bacterium]|nr:hypothetical protein [Kangiellaceae bacterium]
MNIFVNRVLVLLVLFTLSNVVFADVNFEITAGAGRYALDVDRKFAPQIEDDSTVANFSFGVYKTSS